MITGTVFFFPVFMATIVRETNFSLRSCSLSIQFTVSLENWIHDGDPYHTETTPFICRANQWTGFYMIGTFKTKTTLF